MRIQWKWASAVFVVWLTCMSALVVSNQRNQTTLEAVQELNHSIQDMRNALQLNVPFRSNYLDAQELKLQIVYSLRIQLEANHQSRWLTPDIYQLLFTTDQFIDQAKAYLGAEVPLVNFLDEIAFIRSKYEADDSELGLYNQLSAQVFEALFSSSPKSPEVYRALDRLYLISETLADKQKKELQQQLGEASSVLSTYAEGSHLIDKLVTHPIHEEMIRYENQCISLVNKHLYFTMVISAVGLMILALLNLPRRTVMQPVQKQVEQNPQVAEDNPVAKKDRETSQPAMETKPAFLDPEPSSETAKAAERVVEENPVMESKMIDMNKMLDALNDDHESVQLLLSVFVQDHEADIERLHKAMEEDHELACRIAHSLKGWVVVSVQSD